MNFGDSNFQNHEIRVELSALGYRDMRRAGSNFLFMGTSSPHAVHSSVFLRDEADGATVESDAKEYEVQEIVTGVGACPNGLCSVTSGLASQLVR